MLPYFKWDECILDIDGIAFVVVVAMTIIVDNLWRKIDSEWLLLQRSSSRVSLHQISSYIKCVKKSMVQNLWNISVFYWLHKHETIQEQSNYYIETTSMHTLMCACIWKGAFSFLLNVKYNIHMFYTSYILVH